MQLFSNSMKGSGGGQTARCWIGAVAGCLFSTVSFANAGSPVEAKLDPGPLDARHCIRVGVEKVSQALTNTCDQTLEVAWCHSPAKHKWAKSFECGEKDMFYRQHTVLKPGKSKHGNALTLPLDTTIHFGACFGGYSTLKPLDKAGLYVCLDRGKLGPNANKSLSKSFVAYLRKNLHERQLQEQREYLARLPTQLGECIVEKNGAACSVLEPFILDAIGKMSEAEQRQYMELLPTLFESCFSKGIASACEAVDQPIQRMVGSSRG